MAALEKQLLEPRSSSGTSFLGRLFGRARPDIGAPTGLPNRSRAPNRSTTSVTAGRLPGAGVRYSASVRSNVPGAGRIGGGFLQSAATTAAGVAGGALL